MLSWGLKFGVLSKATAALAYDNLTPAAVYSLRLARTAYAGNCLRVRRSSDNAELNIGFLNGFVDTAAILTHIGAGDGRVVTWYDQSGNGRNLTQSTAANQPYIATSGVIELSNSKPTVRFVGAPMQLITAQFACAKTVFTGNVVFKASDIAYQRILTVTGDSDTSDSLSATSAAVLLTLPSQVISSLRNFLTRSEVTKVYTSPIVATSSWDATNNVVYANSVAGTTSAYAAALGTNIALHLGGEITGGAGLTGHVSEVSWFHDLSYGAEISALEANQISYYGIS